MAIEDLGRGMTAAQVREYRELKYFDCLCETTDEQEAAHAVDDWRAVKVTIVAASMAVIAAVVFLVWYSG